MFIRLRHLGVAGAVAVSALTMPVPVGATSSDSADETSTEVPVRIERACLRIPNLIIRTDNVIERINGDAETRGSLLWLDDKIAQASENGREQLTEVLENRRAVREASVPVFETRLTELDRLAERCRDAGVEL